MKSLISLDRFAVRPASPVRTLRCEIAGAVRRFGRLEVGGGDDE